MKKFAPGLVFGLALTLMIGTAAPAQKEKPAAKSVIDARKDVLDVVKLIETGKDAKAISTRIEKLKKDNEELLDVMTVFKTSEKHGLGYTDDPKKGIESAIIELQRGSGPIPVARMKKEQTDLLKVVYVSIAMADIAKHYFPGNNLGKTKKDWDKWSDEQKSTAQDLLKAIKANDGKGAKSAMKKLHDSCVGCHGDFKK